MNFESVLEQILDYATKLSLAELTGLIAGFLAVMFLIRNNVWTWPAGIVYVLVSFFIFAKAKLWGDFSLHIVFLVLNSYGWYYWVYGKKKEENDVPITHSSNKSLIIVLFLSLAGCYLFGLGLKHIHFALPIEPNDLPYWDGITSALSVTGIWLTARKKIDNWYYWFVVDVLSTGIYFYKGLYFYSFLYLIYIGMAVSGFFSWRKMMLAKA
ncbi:MAG: nicotinamide riboside transporter PnuC [Bacteroidota bacterium]